MTQFAEHYVAVKQRIADVCQMTGRAQSSVQLLAVSKTHPASSIEAFYALGQREFGENYLQEALDKMEQLNALDIHWHFIGHVQRNKTKALAEHFDWVHGVDRAIIAERLSNQRPAHLSALNICLQVNIDQQESKDGCHPDEVADLVHHISGLPRISLRGLMVIPAPENHAAFDQAKYIFDQVKSSHQFPEQWDTLSMGMSSDLQIAIEAGATIVRVGTALFGARDYANIKNT